MASGGSAVAAAMQDSVRELARKRRRREDPLPYTGRGPDKNILPGQWTPNALGLPSEEDLSVTCLGIEGDLCHMIDSNGQLRSFKPSDFTHAGISSLFAANPHQPQWAWPRYGKGKSDQPPPIKSFDDDHTRTALMLACSRMGLFSLTDRLRGRGMWKQNGGQLIYHAGEELWHYDGRRMKAIEPGVQEGKLYPRMPELPAPWPEEISADDNPARNLLEGFRKWNWRRPDVDPVLLLGWIGVAYLAGALDWRPAVLLLGDRATGKSTLQKAIDETFGAALFHSSDTTAAGIYQAMRQDTGPVALDELEPGADPRKVQNVVQLMRDSASGAIGRRGGSDGSPSEFQMRSAFLFSAINNPVVSAQDLSRIAVLRLQPLPTVTVSEKPLTINTETTGRMILALMMRQWPRFAETLDFYKRALHKGGHPSRGQDTYGTLLACADLMLGPELADALEVPCSRTLEDQENSHALDYWAKQLEADSLPEVEGALPNWRKCLETLLTVPVQQIHRNGSKPTIGRMLEDLRVDNGQSYTFAQAKADLGDAGLGLVTAADRIAAYGAARRKDDPNYMNTDAALELGLGESDGFILAVPNSHPSVKQLFRDTDWANGSWQDALRQCPIPGVMLTDSRINRVGVAGVQQRCTLVVLSKFEGAPEK